MVSQSNPASRSSQNAHREEFRTECSAGRGTDSSRSDLLATQPEMGRPGRVLGTRELIVAETAFLVPYRVRGERLEIVAEFRGRQRWPEKF